MSKHLLSSQVVLVVLVAGLGCGPLGGPLSSNDKVLIASEPAGDHCTHGGVRITDSDGSVQYACNGAPGDGVQIDSEPPGTNCPNGGLKVTAADDSVSYVCAGDSETPTTATLCPGATWPNAPGGAGMFMQIGGAFPIPGGAHAPEVDGLPAIDDALRVAAICHGFEAVTSGGQLTGEFRHRPFTVVTPLDRAAPLLLQALDQARRLSIHLRVYGEGSFGEDLLTSRMELENAVPVLVEQFTAPDPAQSGARRSWLRLAFVYQRYEYATVGPNGMEVPSDQPTFSALESPTPCVPVKADRATIFAQLKVNGVEIPGTIDVLGTCLRTEGAYSPDGLRTGRVNHGALVLVKPHDSASPTLQQALLQNRMAEVRLTFRERDRNTGEWEETFEEETLQGRVLGYEQFLLDGTRMERIHLGYRSLRQTWLEGTVSYEVDASSP